MKKLILLLIFTSIFLGSQYAQAETISRTQADSLMTECKIFRQQRIEPLRVIEIDKCINEDGKEAAYCTRYFSDYGETYTHKNGTLQIGIFWGSPICDKALKSEKYFKLYPSSDKYNF
ncbi:hypothetical protein Sps_04542 [Shewanella psychrophila]|uniref:Phage protein n=1 Tax=Shewanella psychrophila TaxID=225848 RepID=A0A1S6HVN4_9GAMM|nr:hypothetical protein [Shewanella psychrophila]AQS39627.1 hypothetical protein Sps_04542 [Shewanella psychrophila]